MLINPQNMDTDVKGVPQPTLEGDLGEDNGKPRRPDTLRRFASTPHADDILLMGRTVRIETNSNDVLDLARSFFLQHQGEQTGKPEFRWRIVSQSESAESTPAPLSAFSDPGLRYVNLGRRGFMAVDIESREAVAFLSDQFIKHDARFGHRPPLDVLFCMTAASLGLTALSGGCVGVNDGISDRAVLIFGPPNSGKTTASYLAARLGMEFHADQVVFLEMRSGFLQVGGDPFPAVFRPESIHLLPELKRSARRSTYENLEFYYVDKSPLQAHLARPLTPVCSLFLNRNAASNTELTKLTAAEAVSQLRASLLFDEDEGFDAQITIALTALTTAPIFNLRYDEDPKTAAHVIKTLLS